MSNFVISSLPLQFKVILASASPRRREILGNLGLREGTDFEVIVPPFNEAAFSAAFDKKSVHPTIYVQQSATKKALSLMQSVVPTLPAPQRYLVIGADTVIDLDGVVLEKPTSKDDARDTLRRLSGRTHEVHTGVALFVSPLAEGEEPAAVFSSTTKVKFSQLSESDIDRYVETGEPMDKAGSYGIQSKGCQFVESLEGDYFNVVGLPAHKLSLEIAKLNACYATTTDDKEESGK